MCVFRVQEICYLVAFYVSIYRRVALSCSRDHGVQLTLLTEGLCGVRHVIMSFNLLYAWLVVLIGFGNAVLS